MIIRKERNIEIEEIIKILKNNGLVIMPTETLYGAFVDATNKKSIEKLNSYKRRPYGKPYSVAVSNQTMAEKYANLNKTAKELYKRFLPGPLTVISEGKHILAPGVESEEGTLGIRIPDYKLILKTIKAFGKPLTATSANASYKKRPYKISDILDNLSQKQKNLIDLIVDAGTLPKRDPSTVIDTTLDNPTTIRQGKIQLKNKKEIISKNENDTKAFADKLWQEYKRYAGKRAVIFALEGKMGAGKTIFTKGLAKAMGIEKEIVSPTYDLILDYKINYKNNTNYRNNINYKNNPNLELVHIDAWRLEGSKELDNLGFTKKITDESILAIEWAEKVADAIRRHSEEAIIIWIKIRYGKGKSDRTITWGAI